MNGLKNLISVIFIAPVSLLAMEVDRSSAFSQKCEYAPEYLEQFWNLPYQIHHECFFSLAHSKSRKLILPLFIDKTLSGSFWSKRDTTITFDGKNFDTTRPIAGMLKSSDRKHIALLHSPTNRFQGEATIFNVETGEQIDVSNNFCGRIGYYYLLLDNYFIVLHYKHWNPSTLAPTASYCLNLTTGEEKKIPTPTALVGMYYPMNATSFAWLNMSGESTTDAFYYDIEKDETVKFFSYSGSGFNRLAMSKDGNRIALGSDKLSIIKIFDKIKNKEKWQEVIEFSCSFPSLACISFDASSSNKVSLATTGEPEAVTYDLSNALKVERYLFRNKALLLSGKDEKQYDCELCRAGKECGCVAKGTESKKIRFIDILRESLINLILSSPNGVCLSGKDMKLFYLLPQPVRELLKNKVLNFYYQKKRIAEIDEKERKAKIARQGELTSPGLFLSSNVDIRAENNGEQQQEPLIDEEAEFDKFMRETQSYIDEE